MARPVFSEMQTAPRVRDAIHHFHRGVVEDVQSAVASSDVLIVGMRHNPHVGQAKKMLTQAGIPFTYLGYGSYLSKWKERLAIKLWSGWPTYPQIFVQGSLVGGASDLKAMMNDGSFQTLHDAGRPPLG